MKKQNIMIGIGLFIVIAAVISLFVPYEKDTPRQIYAFDYETGMKDIEDTKSKEGSFLLRTDNVSSWESGSYEKVSERDVYRMEGTGTVEWNFLVEEEGYYLVRGKYMQLDDVGQDMEFDILIDGKLLHEEATITLVRPWADFGEFHRTASGNEMRPRQAEVKAWITDSFRVGGMDEVTVYLEKGNHTITLTNKKESLLLDYVQIEKAEGKNYEAYIKEQQEQDILEQGIAEQDTSKKDEQRVSDYFKKIEAEVTYLKSTPEIYPIFDRSSPLTSPYHPSQIRMNTIGSTNWNKEGQWVEWELEVEEDGYYRIGTRFRQDQNKGMTSGRKILLDGELLFDELKEIRFGYSVGWQTSYLGEEEPYEFYLTAGKHYLRMESTLGSLKELAKNMEESIYSLNDIYRDIIAVTGTTPDVYRDYSLDTAIPDLIDNMDTLYKELVGFEEALLQEYEEDGSAIRIISQLSRQLQSFVKQPYTIQKRLSAFKTNIEAMAVWVFSFKEQPLELDAIYITGKDSVLPQAEASLLGRVGHEIRSFAGTFTQNYNDIDGSKEDNTIDVWVGAGRDYANIIKRIVEENFTTETGIRVNISVVNDALVKATIAGQGPDVNLFTTRGEAMNLAFRNALQPLNGFEGYDELASEYMDGAMIPYEYNGGIYGIVEEQYFYVMFCRMDILDSLGIEPPDTWEELKSLMPVLQGSNLSVGLSYTEGSRIVNMGIGMMNLYPTLLAQNNIDIYNEDRTKTNFDDPKAYEMFKMWTDFYSLYDYPLYKNLFDQFRTGEMPIIISTYDLANVFAKAAPEISGRWVMRQIPGTMGEDGQLNRSTSSGSNATIMTKHAKDKESAWEFIRWWNSADTQEIFAKEMEASYSRIRRHTPANIKAFERSNWTKEEKELLLSQWKQVKEIPEVLGGYYTGRNIDNAFRAVYFDGENARESLEYWNDGINEELLRKQEQALKKGRIKDDK